MKRGSDNYKDLLEFVLLCPVLLGVFDNLQGFDRFYIAVLCKPRTDFRLPEQSLSI